MTNQLYSYQYKNVVEVKIVQTSCRQFFFRFVNSDHFKGFIEFVKSTSKSND